MSIVQVCFDRDVECGSSPKAWCNTCPKLAKHLDDNLDEMAKIYDRISKIRADFEYGLMANEQNKQRQK